MTSDSSRKALARRRSEICRACAHARTAGKAKFLVQCAKCGCVLAAKVQMTGAKCPIGKW